MMISPERTALFVEVCKTGSTAMLFALKERGWYQNGARGYRRIPGSGPGRHAYLTEPSVEHCRRHGIVTFGTVRNPWDRMASLWRSTVSDKQTFWQFLTGRRVKMGSVDILRFPQVQWLYGVDHVLRYEHLQEDLDELHHMLFPSHAETPRLGQHNVSVRRDEPDWTEREVELVADRFAPDIERFGYTGPSAL